MRLRSLRAGTRAARWMLWSWLLIGCGRGQDLVPLESAGGSSGAAGAAGQGEGGQAGASAGAAGTAGSPAPGKPCVADDECGDSVDCTVDRCNPDSGRCENTPDASRCDDHVGCDGVEVCDALLGCRAGSPVTCSDGNACTIDRCVDLGGELGVSCQHDARDADGDGDPDAHCGGGDCDDTSPAVSSKAAELCANGIDDNCNGQVDEQGCVAPMHDACNDPLLIDTPGVTTISLAGAKLDLGASCVPSAATTLRDVVAAVRVPDGDPQQVDLVISWPYGANAAAFGTQCGVVASELACGNGIPNPSAGGQLTRLRVPSLAPGTYPLVIYGSQDYAATVSYRLGPAGAAPTNETCGTAAPLQDGVPVIAPLVVAHPDVPMACGSPTYRDLVYAIELTEPHDVRALAAPTDGIGNAIVSIRQDPCAEASTEKACAISSQASAFARKLGPGTVYVAVASTTGGDVNLLVTLEPPTDPPADESCSAAPPALVPNVTRVINLSNHTDDHAYCSSGMPDAVYDLTLTEPSDVTLMMRTSQGSSGALSLVKPACTSADLLACQSYQPSPMRTSVHGLPAGDYRVVAELTQPTPASLTPLVRPAAAPVFVPFADACDDVFVLPPTGGTFQGNTANVNAQFLAGCDQGGSPNAPDQLLRLDLTAKKRVVLDMSGSSFYTLLDVRRGPSCPGEEVDLGCTIGTLPQRSFLDLTLDAGTYYLQIDGFNGSSGAWLLDVFVVDPLALPVPSPEHPGSAVVYPAMPNASRWGALVVASLPLVPAACSPVATPAAPTPPPTAPPPVVASAPAMPPPPRLSDFVDLFSTTPAPEHEGMSGRAHVVTTRFGRGTFTHRSYQVWGHRGQACPVTRTEGCGSFSLRTEPAAAPPGDLWPTVDPADTPAPVARDDRSATGPFAAPHAWVAFAGGRDAVYALREGGTHIDRIDEQGKVTLFVSDEAMAGWDELWVVERQGHLFVAGMGEPPRRGRYARESDEDAPSGWKLAEVLSGTSGQTRRLGPLTDLPMRPMSSRLNAQGARTASQDGKMAAVRLPQVVALPDEGSDRDRWAMVWLEVIPPPYSWPHDKPQKGVSASATAPRPTSAAVAAEAAKKGARHGCGGPASRSLEDASVTKRAHVTRFAGTRMIDDQVRWTGASVGPVLALQLSPRLDGDQIAVAMPGKQAKKASFDLPRWRGDDDEELKLQHDEQVVSFAYDPAGREGAVVIRDHNRSYLRRFDASGKPSGEVLEVDGKLGSIDEIARIDGKWMAIGGWPRGLYNLSDRTGPFELPKNLTHPSTLVSVEGGGVLLHVDGLALKSLPVGPEGVRGPAVKLEELPTSFDLDRLHTFATGGTSAVSFFERREKPDETDKIAWRLLAPGASWQHTELPSHKPISPYQLSYRVLADDAAVTIERHDIEGFTWLKAGKSTFRESTDESDRVPFSREPRDEIQTGPLLGNGLRLTAEPGPPVRDEVIVGLGKLCERSVMTGPSTIVALCVHPTDAETPTLRVALRTLQVEPGR